jgi:hypothetical protein
MKPAIQTRADMEKWIKKLRLTGEDAAEVRRRFDRLHPTR